MSWSPDGARLAFTHMPTPEAGSWGKTRLSTVASNGSESKPTDIAPIQFWPPTPQYSPDGQWIACETGAAGGHWTSISEMVLYPTPQNSTHDAAVTLTEVSDNQPQLLGWRPDSGGVYVHNRRGLDSEILALPVDGSAPEPLGGGEGRMGTPGGTVIHVNASGQCAFARQTFEQPLAVEVVDLREKAKPRAVASPGVDFASGGPLPQVETLSWQSEDGLDIEGILYLPQDYDQKRDGRLPLLLHIHGGPMALFYRQFSAVPYYYTPTAFCERGIAMLRINPRGSGGYGASFREANRRDWGGGDYRDLMQGVDKVIEMGIADEGAAGRLRLELRRLYDELDHHTDQSLPSRVDWRAGDKPDELYRHGGHSRLYRGFLWREPLGGLGFLSRPLADLPRRQRGDARPDPARRRGRARAHRAGLAVLQRAPSARHRGRDARVPAAGPRAALADARMRKNLDWFAKGD